MAEVPVIFGPDSGPARSSNASAGGMVNCFIEPVKNGKTEWQVYSCPGFKVFGDTGSAFGCRGYIRISQNTVYAVFGEKIYRVNAGGAATEVGTIPGTDYVKMAYNKAEPVEVAIVSGGKRYLLVDDAVSQINDADLPDGAIDVVYIDGYFVFLYPDALMRSSAINDGTSYNALDFTEAEAKPDRGRALGVIGNLLVVFGDDSVEFFQNDGVAEGFPFSPQEGALVERGLLARDCWSTFDNTLAWIDDRGLVVRSEGTVAKTFGTYPVHADIQSTIANQEATKITASTWSFAGHDFFQIWSPDWCWCFDASTGSWFQRKSEDRDTWAGRFLFRAFNRTLVCDAETGKIYEQSDALHDENGKALICSMTSNYIYSGASRTRHNAIFLDVETGVGNNQG